MKAERCDRAFYSTDPVTLARRLLGQRLVRVLDDGTRLSGTVVEVEAYLGVKDRAAHSFGGRRTARVEPMYGRPGTAYVYFTYGMHHCFNVVCGAEDEPVAVLVRALEPAEGLAEMAVRRGLREPVAEAQLTGGPARLCQAMEIDRRLNGIDLVADSRLFVERVRRRRVSTDRVGNSPRIGVAYAGAWASEHLRWFILGNPHVSRSGRVERAPRLRDNRRAE